MNKQTLFLIALFISVAAGIFGTIPGLPLRVAQELISACGILAVLCLFYVKNPWLKFFGLWHIIRSLMFVNEPAIFTLYLTSIVLFFYQFIIDISTDDLIPRILDIVCVIILLQSLMIVFQFFGTWIAYSPVPNQVPEEWMRFNIKNLIVSVIRYPLFSEKWHLMAKTGGLAGTTGNINIASGMLGAGLVAFYRRGWIVLSIVIVAALIITHSLTGVLTAAVASCAYLVIKFKQKSLPWLALIIIGFGVYFYFNETLKNTFEFSSRGPAWKVYFKEIIAMRPWAGWGVAQSPYLATIINKFIPGALWRHPHNEYINILIEVGIIGLIPALGYIATILWRGYKTAQESDIGLIVFLGSAGSLFGAMANFNFHVAAGMLTILFLAMLEYLNKRRKEHEKYYHLRNSICCPGSISA